MNLTKLEMEHNLYGLKNNFWKQIIDGWAHQWGPLVFDIGLHNGIAEPGFYENAKNAFLYSCETLGQPLTIPLYQTLHKIACQHFQGIQNNTGMDNSKTGTFEQANYSLGGLASLFATSTNGESTLKAIKDLRVVLRKWLTTGYADESPEDLNTFDFYNDQIVPECIFKLDVLNQVIKQESSSLGLTNPLCVLSFHNPTPQENFIKIVYTQLDSQKLFNTVQKIFNRFHLAINQASNSQDKLRAIAHLFQTLEWLHPFPDGQGRTDLLLLGKLLSEYGFHPAILNLPYVSSYVPLNEWVNYLKKGLLAWEKEKQELIDSNNSTEAPS